MSHVLDKIKSIKRQFEGGWMALPEVMAVGIGTLSDGDIGIIVTVRENSGGLKPGIPSSIDGVTIEIRKSDEIRAL